MRIYVRFFGLCCIIGALSTAVEAKVTFLPDWMASDMDFGYSDFGEDVSDEDNSIPDEKFCRESGLYHEADGCPTPQIFDEFCPYDDSWISDCYCPSVFNKTCASPERGDDRVTVNGYSSCGNQWVACCTPGVNVDASTCENGTTTCKGGCGDDYICCASCEEGGSSFCTGQANECGENQVEVSSCMDCSGTKLYTCEDKKDDVPSCVEGGSSSCTGQANECGENQVEVSSCMDCSGTKLYTCEDKVVDEGCAISCTVGMIYYSDGTCSADVLSDKTPIGVVVKDNELIIATQLKNTGWGEFGVVVSGVSETIDTAVAKNDYAGRANTAAIMSHYNGNSSAASFAAVYCANYATTATTKGQWYLPAAGETYHYLYKNYAKVKAAWNKLGVTVQNSLFWASTEYDSYGAWYINSSNGTLDFYSKYNVSGNYRTAGCFAPIGGCLEVCSSDYKNTCSGTGYASGTSEACGGYYKSCECSDGYIWNGSACIPNCIEGGSLSDTSCVVGNIYYSDGTCNACIVAGKTSVGVVVKDNELVMNKAILMKWSDDSVDLSALDNLESDEAQDDMKGQANTKAIVNHYGSSASGVAGVYCYNYVPSGMENSKNKWYLPAAGELYKYLAANYTKLNNAYSVLEWRYLDKSGSANMYSSTEKNETGVWIMYPQSTSVSGAKKFNEIGVVCYLPIGENTDNNDDKDNCIEEGDKNCTGSTSCTYGYSSSCKTCSGDTLYVCNECADGGTKTCLGQPIQCGENQTEISTCLDCFGTKLYTCEDKKVEESSDDTCGVTYIYNEVNCPLDSNYHCSDTCGGKYSDCKPLLWTGNLVYKAGQPYAINEKYCPGEVKDFTIEAYYFDSIAYRISNGKDTYKLCSTADKVCHDLARSTFQRGNTSENITINLSSDINCGNEMIRNGDSWYGAITTTINGNGHTITFDKPSGTDFYNSGSKEGNPRLIIKNAKIVSNASSVPYEERPCPSNVNGVFSRQIAKGSSYDDINVYFEDVVIETQHSVGENAIFTGTNYIKMFPGGRAGVYNEEVGSISIVDGVTNITGFSKVNNGVGMIVKGGTVNLNMNGKRADLLYMDGGTANVCADSIYMHSISKGGVINSSTSSIIGGNNSVVVNHVSDLCNSSVFSGSFWR